MTHKPDDDRDVVQRVSPTAPESKSASANVWRLLESNPTFREGMKQAGSDFSTGRVSRASDFLKRPR